MIAVACVGAAELVGLMVFASPSSKCSGADSLHTIPVVIQGDLALKTAVKDFLKSHPIIKDPETGTKLSMIIVKPDPSTDYKIIQIRPDPNTEYSGITLGPNDRGPASELDRELQRSIREWLKRNEQSGDDASRDSKESGGAAGK